MNTDFLAGVIEGFYGRPWSQAERFELFDWMGRWKLNTYLYAPKDDLKHRAIWREAYTSTEAQQLSQLIRRCKRCNVRFIYALSPGLDIRYSRKSEVEHLKKRFAQMQKLGCENFALLFDDIPDRLDTEDIRQWGSLAAAQCHVTNTLFRWIRERQPKVRFLFCPTPYCSRMVERGLGGKGYLETVGQELHREIDIFWTGPEIISREITDDHVRELQTALRRKPLIWDNLHANDYDGRRFFCGPYAGRPLELRDEVSGLLSNPNCEFQLNYIPFRTLAHFVNGRGPWNPRRAYLSAMREWSRHFASLGRAFSLDDLVLFGDCYYLPHEEGPEAEALFERAKVVLAEGPVRAAEKDVTAFRQQAARLQDICVRMADLRERPLFYALSRRIWELREEMDLMQQYVEASQRSSAPSLTSHLLGTYRGGFVARLQRLLVQQPDGTFTPAESAGRLQATNKLRQSAA
jgi:protein O-GlcNAcase/histone acetyltransferase